MYRRPWCLCLAFVNCVLPYVQIISYLLTHTPLPLISQRCSWLEAHIWYHIPLTYLWSMYKCKPNNYAGVCYYRICVCTNAFVYIVLCACCLSIRRLHNWHKCTVLVWPLKLAWLFVKVQFHTMEDWELSALRLHTKMLRDVHTRLLFVNCVRAEGSICPSRDNASGLTERILLNRTKWI